MATPVVVRPGQRVRVATWLPTTTVFILGPLLASVRAVSVLPRPLHGGYDTWTHDMAHVEDFAPQSGVELSSHEEPSENVDDFFTNDPWEVRGAPQLAHVDVLSGWQLSGAALVATLAQVESTRESLGARVSRAPERLTLSRRQHPALRKAKRGHTSGHRPGVGRGDGGGGAVGGVAGGE